MNSELVEKKALFFYKGVDENIQPDTGGYTGGELILDSEGPWLDEGMLKASGITAMNYTCKNGEYCTETLCFITIFSGHFDNLPCLSFEVTALYAGDPLFHTSDSQPAYFEDSLHSASITIQGPDPNILANLFPLCAEGAKNHGNFVACVARATNALKRAGIISDLEKVAIQSCAAQSDIP